MDFEDLWEGGDESLGMKWCSVFALTSAATRRVPFWRQICIRILSGLLPFF